jgi:RNA polymerase sigma-70 factor (ECF subfamily)
MASSELAFSSAESLSAASAAEPALVERCRQGDTQAFARLVSLHEGMVLNLAARLLGDREEAKDIAQDVFLQVYRTLPRFEGRSTVRTWIYRIVVNQCCNRQRWWRRRRRAAACPLDEITAADEAKMSAVSPAEGPFERLDRRERAGDGDSGPRAIVRPPRGAAASRVEGLSCEEIATTLALPIGQSRAGARGRDGLRRALASRGEEKP